MSNVVPFKRPKLREKHRGNTLCREGFHKWVIDKTSLFDVKKGALLTRYRCKRCNATRVEAK